MQATEPTSSSVAPSVGRMIRAVGHDVRNKLAVMKNSIYYLSMKLGHDDEKVQRHLRIMGREIADANRIITDLMDFVHLKEPVRCQGDVKAIVAGSLADASLRDGWKTVLSLDDNLPAVMADALQLQRAFTNIILRIVDFTCGPELPLEAIYRWTGKYIGRGCCPRERSAIIMRSR